MGCNICTRPGKPTARSGGADGKHQPRLSVPILSFVTKPPFKQNNYLKPRHGNVAGASSFSGPVPCAGVYRPRLGKSLMLESLIAGWRVASRPSGAKSATFWPVRMWGKKIAAPAEEWRFPSSRIKRVDLRETIRCLARPSDTGERPEVVAGIADHHAEVRPTDRRAITAMLCQEDFHLPMAELWADETPSISRGECFIEHTNRSMNNELRDFDFRRIWQR